MQTSAVVASCDEKTVQLIDAGGRRLTVGRECVDPRLLTLHPGQQVQLHRDGDTVTVRL